MGWRIAKRTADPDPVGPRLINSDLRKIANNVRQHIGLWIADFIEHLLRHRTDRHHPAAQLRFGTDKGTVA